MSSVVVAGALANKPYNGGEAWVRLSWVLGLARLGIEPWFVEELDPTTGADAWGRPAPLDRSVNAEWFDAVVERFGLGGRASLVEPDGAIVRGPPAGALRDALASADLLLNISGNLTAPALLRLPARRAYLDLDPGYTQYWHADGLLGAALDRHHHLLTVALAVGRPGCVIPTGGRRWLPVPPPVVLDQWPAADVPCEPLFTTVGSWRGGLGRLEHDGRSFGQKAHEFRRFADVPRTVGQPFEAALDIRSGDAADRDRLLAGGWRLRDPCDVAGSPDAFRAYVRRSSAEFSPAQGVYVETASGWFSDRTARYLASGRAAVVQDTALPAYLKPGEGLLTFRDPPDAVRAIREVASDPRRHGAAARRIAEEHLDSDRVLRDLLGRLL